MTRSGSGAGLLNAAADCFQHMRRSVGSLFLCGDGDYRVTNKAESAGNTFWSDVSDAFFANTPDIAYIKDAEMVYLGASEGFARCLGLKGRGEIIGRTALEIIPDKEAAVRYDDNDRDVLESGKNLLDFLEPIPSPDGGARYGKSSKYIIRDAEGMARAVLSITRDVTREIEVRDDYQQELRQLLRLASDAYGVWLFDVTEWRVVDCSVHESGPMAIPPCGEIDEFISTSLEVIDDEEALSFVRGLSRESVTELYKSGKRKIEIEFRQEIPNAGRKWVRLVVQMLTDPTSGHLMAIITPTDIDAIKNTQRELAMAAEIDSMTGLLNHDAAFSYMKDFLLSEGQCGTHALFMIDRDGLKQINDTFGHQAGDDVIVSTARAVKDVFRESDIAGRVGGDEFLVLMKNVGSVQAVHRKAVELLHGLRCVSRSGLRSIESSGSIGITLYTGPGKTLDELYAEADNALYKAKSAGRNRYVIFGAETGTADDQRRAALIANVNLQALLNNIDGGVLILHAEKGEEPAPVFFSDSFLSMMGGLTGEEAFKLYGDDFFGSIHEDDRSRARADYASALEHGGPMRTTYRLIGKNREYHWLSAGMNITRNSDGSADVYGVHTNVEKLMKREAKLASDEQLYRVAFSQTPHMLCEIDITAGTIFFYDKDGSPPAGASVISGLPEALIKSGFIQAESAGAFRTFYSEMCSGSKEGKGLFKCRHPEDESYEWTAISYQVLFDESGKPEKAIGSIEKLPNIEGAQARLSREERLMNALRGDMIATAKVNLTRNKVEFINSNDTVKFPDSEQSYSELIDMIIATSCRAEDALLLQLNLARESMIETYTKGNCWLSVEYKSGGDDVRWIEITACIIEEPVSRELYVFLYAGDVEKRRGTEACQPIPIERDPVTHLYTSDTTEKLIDSLMRNSNSPDRLFSLAIIHMTGLPALRTRIGAVNASAEQMYFSRMFYTLLDSDCILGRYTDDSMLVFCPDSQSNEWMTERIQNAFRRIRAVYDNEEPKSGIRLICGIATERARSAGLAGMRSQALQICNAYRNSETDVVSSFEQYVDTFRVSEEDLKVCSYVPINQEELTRHLLGAEKEVMSECMAAMLGAERYDDSVDVVLSTLGRYYNSHRVYILALLNSGATVSMQHEWATQGSLSMIRRMAGVPLNKLPLFKRALAAARPIALGSWKKNGDKDSWRFIVLPIILSSRIVGFLCIDNPQVHTTDVALPHALIPILLHERARFGVSDGGMKVAGRDELTGLSDNTAFNSDMQAFNPDAFHSIGTLYVAAVNLHGINRTRGVEYGDEMLVFAAHTLSDVFKRATIYRTSGQEFAVICTNLSREAFLGQCTRVRSMFQRRYLKSFCYGEVWSDQNVSARKLLKDAELLAHNGVDKQAVHLPDKKVHGVSNLEKLKEAFANGSYYICLQPKVDMRTGKVVGAEALSRRRDSEGYEIMPSEFISKLEESGLIRELDFFAMDQAFQVLQSWIERGTEPIPISVNFSRQTLLSQTVLASVLAIRSRYDVPDGFLEIEMTESMGDCDVSTLQRVMEGLKQQGFSFALDDLGSEYSSLKTLGHLTFDTVKLDMALINSFLYNSMSRSIVESVISVCAKNGLTCIAEGVKSEEHVKGLLESGCVYGQGYFYGKPIPAEDFYKKFLSKG